MGMWMLKPPYQELVDLYKLGGKKIQSIEMLQRGLTLYEIQYGFNAPKTLDMVSLVAYQLVIYEMWDMAEKPLGILVQSYKKIPDLTPGSIYDAVSRLARACGKQGKLNQARQIWVEIMEGYDNIRDLDERVEISV